MPKQNAGAWPKLAAKSTDSEAMSRHPRMDTLDGSAAIVEGDVTIAVARHTVRRCPS
jgi:hypothetical protein